MLAGAVDSYLLSAVDAALEVTRGKFSVETVRTKARLGDGNFGTVYEAVDLPTGRALVVKQAKNVQGAIQLQNAEEYMNRRIRRAPLVAWGCAPFLGSYHPVEGAASPHLAGGSLRISTRRTARRR